MNGYPRAPDYLPGLPDVQSMQTYQPSMPIYKYHTPSLPPIMDSSSAVVSPNGYVAPSYPESIARQALSVTAYPTQHQPEPYGYGVNNLNGATGSFMHSSSYPMVMPNSSDNVSWLQHVQSLAKPRDEAHTYHTTNVSMQIHQQGSQQQTHDFYDTSMMNGGRGQMWPLALDPRHAEYNH